MSKIISKFRRERKSSVSLPNLNDEDEKTSFTSCTSRNTSESSNSSTIKKEYTDLIDWLNEIVKTASTRCQEMASKNVPWEIQLHLNSQVEELLRFRREAVDSQTEMERISYQLQAVQAFTETAKHQLRNVRAEEEAACQKLAEACWKPLRGKWLSLKNKRNQNQLKKFIEEAKEKQHGLELLIEISTSRLDKLNKQQQSRLQRRKKTKVAIEERDETGEEGDDEEEWAESNESGIELFVYSLYN